jgi:uncharacterized protein YlxP (DUF503 family)
VVIGSLVLTLHLPQSHSLKDKRQVVSSLTRRVQRTFNVAAAEVESLDSWQLAVIGVACVSNDRRHADQVLNKVANWVAEDGGRGEALLTRQDIELIQT